MSKSFRTQQPAAAAARRLRRDADGSVALPRIVARRARRGDRHPLPVTVLRGILRREVPIEYLNGLSRIELRPRASTVVGEPFAYYAIDEKAIILYSLPLEWYWNSVPPDALLNGMRRFFGEVIEEPGGTRIVWPSAEVLGVWFYVEVLAHELGHHYRNQYRIRRGNRRHRRHEEFVADLHSARFYHAFLARLQAKRPRRAT